MAFAKKELFDKQLQKTAEYFKALAHPARLQILKYLAETKSCITGDISEELPLSRTTVNQHLTELKKAGLVMGHISGVKTNYCLNNANIAECKKIFTNYFKEINIEGNMKVLILCTGNSCRSQMAHGFLKSFDNNIAVCSAGTDPGKEVNPKAIVVMKESGIDISNHKPTFVDEYLNEEWDYVITVCDDANETCPAFFGKVNHRLHIGFEDPSKATGTDEFIWSEFRRVRDAIKEKFLDLHSQMN